VAKKNKMRTLMLSQTDESRMQSSLDIEHWMKGDLKQTVDYFLSRYQVILERKLGYDRHDLLNEIREQVWKGLISHDGTKSNLKTYLNTLIKNRFKTLYGRSTLDKFSLVDYYPDVYSNTNVDPQYTETTETGESIYEMRQTVLQDLVGLQHRERLIYEDLLCMENISTMMQKHAMTKIEVIGTINTILTKLKRDV
jgi:DNA-directed RNA polymerase specialized sigma24 family protein